MKTTDQRCHEFAAKNARRRTVRRGHQGDVVSLCVLLGATLNASKRGVRVGFGEVL